MDYNNYNNYNNYAPMTPRPRIDNIFSALVYEKTAGAIMEFSLWCAVCVAVLLSLVATIVEGGNIVWVLFLLVSAGMAALMAFRLKPIVLLYGAGTMNLLMFVIIFICYWGLGFILCIPIVILGIVLLVFAFIHFFARVSFPNLITILVIIDSSLTAILTIIGLRHILSGAFAYLIMLTVVSMYYGCVFWGCIDNPKEKIGNANGTQKPETVTKADAVQKNGFIPALKGICGTYAGQMISLQGGEVTIGSQQCHLIIQDPFVSARHCSIRFNMTSGYYEVLDISGSGTYLSNGNRLQPGVYNSLQRGSVIVLGSQNQQFQLM